MTAAIFHAYGNPLRVCDGADFDGTNDFMTRGADLTGLSNSKSGILSFWKRLDGSDGLQQVVLGNQFFDFGVQKLASNVFQLFGFNEVASATCLDLRTSAAFTAGASWLHILTSWNLAVAGSGRLYVNDVSDKIEVAYVNNNIGYTAGSDWSVGALAGDPFKLDGCLAEVYFAPGQYLDFDLVPFRRRFRSASGKPVHLGSDGSLPTGTAPAVYQHLDDGEAVANFATNRGSGGNFTITGTLGTGSTSPSD